MSQNLKSFRKRLELTPGTSQKSVSLEMTDKFAFVLTTYQQQSHAL